MRRLATLDATAKIKHVDYQPFEDISKLDPRLTREKCHSVIHLLTKDGQLFGGFSAFRALTLRLPLLYLFAPILHLPGMKWVGDAVYAFIAKNRYLFHRKAACQDNACLR
jgi:predicted DCC family thiol-disulfide oxidoreductase YuxK